MDALPKLNLPSFNHKLKTISAKTHIWDELRKAFVLLTPEEWVRQHIVHALIAQNYPAGLIAQEKGFKVGNGRQKRFDVMVATKEGKPFLLVECKAPDVPIDDKVVQQVAQYNTEIKAPYFLLSNGLATHCFSLEKEKPVWLKNIPAYPGLHISE